MKNKMLSVLICFTILSSLLLTGCGVKGPLYYPVNAIASSFRLLLSDLV